MTKMFLYLHRSVGLVLQKLFLISLGYFMIHLNCENSAWVKSPSEEQIISTHLNFQKETIFSFLLAPLLKKVDLYLITITVS